MITNRPFALLRSAVTCGLVLLTSALVYAADAPREKLLLNPNWKFSNGDPADAGKLFDYPESDSKKQTPESEKKEAELAAKRVDPVKTNLGSGITWVKPEFDDSKWRTVNLPHDWAIEMPFSRGANNGKGSKQLDEKDGTGIGWYRRSFEIPSGDKGRTVWIEFGGAYRNTLVWLNGHCLGRMESGYTSFYYDVSKFLNYGGKNSLVVRCEAFKNEGWFYEGAGIYRHVWLIKTNPVHVAHWGTYVTSTVSGASATVNIETTVENAAGSPAQATVVSEIQDASGKVVASTESPVQIPAGSQFILKQTAPVANPQLWSPETPNLYALVTRIKSGTSETDLYKTPFGIRTIEFTANDGFLLNGKKRFIKGFCNHQDFAGVGVAVPDRLQEYRVAMMKDIGADGWRTAHNPVNEEVLDECDRQGMMVMDETRRLGKYNQPMADLKAMMLRDRNHPSIVMWSLGNEEKEVQSTAYGADIAEAMQNLAHQIDPSRPCTIAMNGHPRGKLDHVGFDSVLDVVGINYIKAFGSPDESHRLVPERRFIASEEGSELSTRGLYFQNRAKCHLSSYFDQSTAGWSTSGEEWWNFYKTRPYVAGAFHWTGFDYRGEPTPYGWPCISSHFGTLDTCGFPKDNSYFYKAWWTAEPVLHVYPHWNWNQVSHRIIRINVKPAIPAELKFSVNNVRMKKDDGKGWEIYNPGDLRAITISVKRSVWEPDTQNPGKTKEKSTDLVKQDVTLKDGGDTVSLLPLKPEYAELLKEITVSVTPEESPIDVWVQTNFEEAELFVNGTSKGRKKVEPFQHLEWKTPYAPGNISVIGYKGGQAVKTTKIETTGAPASLRVTANRTDLKADGEDVVLLKVETLDDQGRFVPTASNLIRFEVSGSGKLIGVGNGDPSCHESDLGPERSLFGGLALGIVQTSRQAGNVTVKVTAPGLKETVLTLPVKDAPSRPYIQ